MVQVILEANVLALAPFRADDFPGSLFGQTDLGGEQTLEQAVVSWDGVHIVEEFSLEMAWCFRTIDLARAFGRREPRPEQGQVGSSFSLSMASLQLELH